MTDQDKALVYEMLSECYHSIAILIAASSPDVPVDQLWAIMARGWNQFASDRKESFPIPTPRFVTILQDREAMAPLFKLIDDRRNELFNFTREVTLPASAPPNNREG